MYYVSMNMEHNINSGTGIFNQYCNLFFYVEKLYNKKKET